MPENPVEIAVQIGNVSITYKGDRSFLESGALQVIGEMIRLGARQDITQDPPSATQTDEAVVSEPAKKLTTKTIAARLNAKTGTDLAMAAIAYLAIFAGRNEFTRQEILSEMKSATGFYKANMSSNLSKILSKLMKDKLNETGKGRYSLREDARAKLVNELA